MIALQDITRHAYNSPFTENLGAALINSMKLLLDRLLYGKPRVVSKILEFLFTDASFENSNSSGLGSVRVSNNGKVAA